LMCRFAAAPVVIRFCEMRKRTGDMHYLTTSTLRHFVGPPGKKFVHVQEHRQLAG
jgi:hypothetical protein